MSFTIAEKVSSIKVNGKAVPFPYRVHDQPDEEKLIPFVEFAKKFGYQFNTRTPAEIAKSFNEMLTRVQGLPEQRERQINNAGRDDRPCCSIAPAAGVCRPPRRAG